MHMTYTGNMIYSVCLGTAGHMETIILSTNMAVTMTKITIITITIHGQDYNYDVDYEI